MKRKKRPLVPESAGQVCADVKEATAVEPYWHPAGRAKRRRPPKNYK